MHMVVMQPDPCYLSTSCRAKGPRRWQATGKLDGCFSNDAKVRSWDDVFALSGVAEGCRAETVVLRVCAQS